MAASEVLETLGGRTGCFFLRVMLQEPSWVVERALSSDGGHSEALSTLLVQESAVT